MICSAVRALGVKPSSAVFGHARRFVLAGPTYAYAYGTVSCSALPVFDRVLKRRVSVSMDGMFTSFTA